jgi:hypothetical protein
MPAQPITQRNPFVDDLINALGIDTHFATRVVITIPAEGVITVEVASYMTDGQGERVDDVLKKYHLQSVEIDPTT